MEEKEPLRVSDGSQPFKIALMLIALSAGACAVTIIVYFLHRMTELLTLIASHG